MLRKPDSQSKDLVLARGLLSPGEEFLLLIAVVNSFAMLLPDKQIWWEASNSVRIPTAIIIALALGFRIYSIYRSSKNTHRSARVRHLENVVAITLWSFIAVGVILLLLFKR